MPIEWGGINLQSNLSASVQDNTSAPTTILDANDPFAVKITWDVPAALAPYLGGQFRLRVYVESMGPGQEQQIGQLVVPVVPGQTAPYNATINVPGNTLLGEGAGSPAVSGVYKGISVLQHLNGGATEGSGFNESPLIQMRQP